MTNVLIEKVKELADDLKDIVYQCTGWRIESGLKQPFIALLEADCDRLNNRIGEVLDKQQGNEQMWIVRELRREITYKQQAIEELKNLN